MVGFTVVVCEHISSRENLISVSKKGYSRTRLGFGENYSFFFFSILFYIFYVCRSWSFLKRKTF